MGADGLPRAVWAGLTGVLVALSVLLFVLGYSGYGALLIVLALAAAVNTW